MEDQEILNLYKGITKSHNDLSQLKYVDHFGIIHNDLNIVKKLDKAYERIRKLDAKREHKWRKMLYANHGLLSSTNPSITRPSEKVIRRVYKGIPSSLRGEVWSLFLGTLPVRQNQRGVYQDMLTGSRIHSAFVRQIHLDVQRTFRDTSFYCDNYSTRMRSLFNVLLAYSVYNAEIGYTQGMNEVAGFFLMHLHEEEDAFWALSQFMCSPKWDMHGCFVPALTKCFRFFKHLEKIFERFLPKLWRHFQRYNIQPDAYAIKWYMMCFLGRVPISLCYRLWDIFLLEGEVVLHAMSYNILKLHKGRLISMDDAQVYQYLQTTIAKSFGFDDDATVDSLKICIEEIRKAGLDRIPPPASDSGERPTRPMGELVREKRLQEVMERQQQELEQQSQLVRPSEGNSIRRKSNRSLELVDDRTGRPRSHHPQQVNGDLPRSSKVPRSLFNSSRPPPPPYHISRATSSLLPPQSTSRLSTSYVELRPEDNFLESKFTATSITSRYSNAVPQLRQKYAPDNSQQSRPLSYHPIPSARYAKALRTSSILRPTVTSQVQEEEFPSSSRREWRVAPPLLKRDDHAPGAALNDLNQTSSTVNAADPMSHSSTRGAPVSKMYNTSVETII